MPFESDTAWFRARSARIVYFPAEPSGKSAKCRMAKNKVREKEAQREKERERERVREAKNTTVNSGLVGQMRM